jgi:hypothetical protein
MSIFDRNTDQDESDIQDWLQEIRSELKQTATGKSSVYAFDFLQNKPVENNASRFKWENDQREDFPCKKENTSLASQPKASKARLNSLSQLQSYDAGSNDLKCMNFPTFN